MRQENGYYIAKAGNFASVKGTDAQIAYAQLETDLVAQRKAFADSGINPDDIQVIISPTSNVTLDNLVPAMGAATQAGFKKIGFGMAQ